MEAMQLFRFRVVAVPNARWVLCAQAQSSHHWFPLDVVEGSEELASLRAFGTEGSMVESDVPQDMVRGPSEARR